MSCRQYGDYLFVWNVETGGGKMRFKAVIFDLDGTLVDSAPDLRLAVNLMLADLGRPELSLTQITSFIGDGVEKLVERALAASHLQTSGNDALAMFRTYYAANLTTLTRPYPGVVEALQKLQNRGVNLGICTNKPTGPAKQICEALDLDPHFSVITGAKPGVSKKPDAAPLVATMIALNVEARDTLFIGDSITDLRTALNAGVAFAWFTGGYLNASAEELEEIGFYNSFAKWSDLESVL